MKKYFGMSVAIVSSAVVVLLIFFCIYKFSALTAGIRKLISILMPIVVGVVFAYVLSPLYNWLRHRTLRLLHHTLKWRSRNAVRCAGIVAMLGTFAATGALICGLLALIVPQIVQSISNFAATLPSNMMQVSQNLQKLLANNPELEQTAMSLYAQSVNYVEEWIQNSITPSVQDAMGYISIGVMSTVSFFKNFLIGLIVAVYLLSGKDRFLRQLTRCIYAIFGRQRGNIIMGYSRYANQVFTGFISGKLLDSLIIFVLSLFVLSLMNMPYAVLVSVIVGVTNIIPFFGPFIGAVPSFVIILLTSPIQSVYFLIFILVLQQFDGNILGPKILGNSTGLPSFWVLFAILLFGGLFGFGGMLIGVPVFAVLAHIFEDMLKRSLTRQRLPKAEEDYAWLDHISERGKPVRRQPKQAEVEQRIQETVLANEQEEADKDAAQEAYRP